MLALTVSVSPLTLACVLIALVVYLAIGAAFAKGAPFWSQWLIIALGWPIGIVLLLIDPTDDNYGDDNEW